MNIEKWLTSIGISEQISQWISHNGFWIIEVFIVVIATLAVNLIARYILKRIEKSVTKTKNPWDDAFFSAIHKPLATLIWIIGIGWAAEMVASQSDATIFNAIKPVQDITIILLITWFLVRFIKLAQLNLTDPNHMEKPMDETTAAAIGKLLRISVILTATLVSMQSFGYSISGVLAFGGVGGIAIGFAAKDLLANFFGSIMIYLDRPFNVGDWVRSPDKNIEGTVENIGWRLTRIRTFDKRPLYVPNSTFTSISVENPSRMTNRRIYETIGIRYDDATKLPAIINDVKEMLKIHDEIDTKQTLIVNFNQFAASSLDFFIYTFTKTTNWIRFHEIKQDVLIKILNIIEENHAEVAYPTSTLHLSSEPDVTIGQHDSNLAEEKTMTKT